MSGRCRVGGKGARESRTLVSLIHLHGSVSAIVLLGRVRAKEMNLEGDFP